MQSYAKLLSWEADGAKNLVERGKRHEKGSADCSADPRYVLVRMIRLEVYVSTESDVVAAYTQIEAVLLVDVILCERVSDAANVCNEANLLADSVRDTGLDSNLPQVSAVLITAYVSVYIRETTVSEEREVTSLGESVTNVGVQNESVSVVICSRNIHAKHWAAVLTVCEANLNSNIELVV